MRYCTVLNYVKGPDGKYGHEPETLKFLGWGLEAYELRHRDGTASAASHTAAILEAADGSIRLENWSLIRFIDSDESKNAAEVSNPLLWQQVIRSSVEASIAFGTGLISSAKKQIETNDLMWCQAFEDFTMKCADEIYRDGGGNGR